MIATIFQLSSKAASRFLRSPGLRSAETARADQKLSRLAGSYAVWWTLSLLTFTVIISLRAENKPIPSSTGLLENKLAFYHEHKSQFDFILLGDSLAYTGLHPEFIDPELGTHSINLAAFSNWFATQYPFVRDLIPEIPRGTRVLLAVHLYDFNDAGLTVQHVYPVGVRDALLYWSWNAPNPGLLDNVLYYNALTRFFMRRDELRARLILRGEKPLERFDVSQSLVSQAKTLRVEETIDPDRHPSTEGPVALKAAFPSAPQFVAMQQVTLPDSAQLRDRLTEYYAGLPFVAAASPVSDKGQINSVVLALKGGGYYRIELTPEYFREKQREMAKGVSQLDDDATRKFVPPALGPVSLKMFEAILEAFSHAGIPVTVNAMEEAPFTFPNEIVREKYRRLVDQTLQPIARRFGDDYVHADYTSIVDSDYFDYNHFNSDGVAKYTPLLIHALRKTRAFEVKWHN